MDDLYLTMVGTEGTQADQLLGRVRPTDLKRNGLKDIEAYDLTIRRMFRGANVNPASAVGHRSKMIDDLTFCRLSEGVPT